jgi:hypothetical protein
MHDGQQRGSESLLLNLLICSSRGEVLTSSGFFLTRKQCKRLDREAEGKAR